jgi:hypothetical protein
MRANRLPLDDPEVKKLTNHIKNSFRVERNHDPIYVDVADHIDRLRAQQHQIIFGRRGSGKSCLLVHYHRAIARTDNVLSIYISADEIKTLTYPDLLIRLLLTIGNKVAQGTAQRFLGVFHRRHAGLRSEIKALRIMLDQADTAEVSDERSSRSNLGVGASAGGARAEITDEVTARRTSRFKEAKVQTLERHLQDYKDELVDAMSKSNLSHAVVLVDDFYLIDRQWQPDVIDYLHRLLRGSGIYLKVATVRHRTSHVRYDGSRTIGVELAQDVEAINLDQTFEDMDSTRAYLANMLDSMAKDVGMENCSGEALSDDGLLQLTLASGGVPRDFLTIFVDAVDWARSSGNTRWLTPTAIYKGAGRNYYRTKLRNLRSDLGPDADGLETVFQDLYYFCLKEKRKTAFLVSQEDAGQFAREHELIQQLMDFKLIHVIEPDTSAASGRSGRFEAYTLDFAIFMEPRQRNIEIVEFWRIDDQRRRVGVREAPVYELSKAQGVLAKGRQATTESAIESIQAEADRVQAEAAPTPESEEVKEKQTKLWDE